MNVKDMNDLYSNLSEESIEIFEEDVLNFFLSRAIDDAGTEQDATVAIYLLSNQGDGTASDELIATGFEALDAIRPLTDKIEIYAATIKHYQLTLDISLASGAG